MYCYCINPYCNDSKNSLDDLFCRGCKSELLLDSQYRVIKKLGENDYISTYEIDERGEAKILKVLYNYDDENLERFKEQISILTTKNIKGIAKLEKNSYFRFVSESIKKPLHCIVIEKVLGQNLKQWIENRDNPIKDNLAINWLLQLTRIIGKLHDQKIIHGNINPEHIILTPSGELILTNLPCLPITFTKGYAPREQEEGYLFPQSDFFSLGRTFVYLLTKKEPLSSYDPFTDQLNWREENNIVNGELADYIDYLMARLPNNRPKNIESITRRLNEIDKGFGQVFTAKRKDKKESQKEFLNVSIDNISPHESDSQVSKFGKRKSRKKNRKKLKKSKLIKLVRKNWLIILPLMICTGIVGSYTLNYFKQTYNSHPLIVIKSILSIKNTFGENSGVISQLIFSSDGEQILSTGSGNVINIWDVNFQEGIILDTLQGHNAQVETIAFSPNNDIMASGSEDQTIKIWDIVTDKEQKNLIGHNSSIKAIAFNPDGNILASGDANGRIVFWNTKTFLPMGSFFAHQDWISSLYFSPDGTKLLSASGDKTIKIWDMNTYQEIKTINAHNAWVSSAKFSPDGKKIASASGDRTIKLWDAQSGEELYTLKGHNQAVNDLDFSKNGKYLVSGGNDRQIKIWSVETGKLINTFAGHTDKINSVVFSPTDNILASGDNNGTIKLWQVDSK